MGIGQEMQLVSENDQILQKSVANYDFDNTEVNLIELIAEMFDFMKDDGIGLAAPQIGSDVRCFIMKINDKKYVCINPKIIANSDEKEIDQEGCLSFPNLYFKVRRSKEVVVHYWDEYCKEQNKVFADLIGRCFQHELDHLNGITFDKRVSKLVLNMAKKRRVKTKRRR